MPTIYKYFGLSFFFYANDHLPVHVHIEKENRATVAVFEMLNGKLENIRFKKISGANMLTPAELDLAKSLLTAKHEIILQRWTDFFVKNKKSFRTITITKRIK